MPQSGTFSTTQWYNAIFSDPSVWEIIQYETETKNEHITLIAENGFSVRRQRSNIKIQTFSRGW